MDDVREGTQANRSDAAASRALIAARAALAVIAAYVLAWLAATVVAKVLYRLSAYACARGSDPYCRPAEDHVLIGPALLLVLFVLLAGYAAWEWRRSGTPALRVLAGAAVGAAAVPFLTVTLGIYGPQTEGWHLTLLTFGIAGVLGAAAAVLPAPLFLVGTGLLALCSLALTVVFLPGFFVLWAAALPAAAAFLLGAAFGLRMIDLRAAPAKKRLGLSPSP